MAETPSERSAQLNNCAAHPKTPAITLCKKCGEPLCEDCRYYSSGKWYCAGCFDRAHKNINHRSRWIVLVCGLLLAATLVSIGLSIAGKHTLFVLPFARSVGEEWLNVGLWHIFDVPLMIGAIAGLLQKRGAGKWLRMACALSAVRGLAWGLAASSENIALFAGVFVGSAACWAFFMTRAGTSDFRAITP